MNWLDKAGIWLENLNEKADITVTPPLYTDTEFTGYDINLTDVSTSYALSCKLNKDLSNLNEYIYKACDTYGEVAEEVDAKYLGPYTPGQVIVNSHEHSEFNWFCLQRGYYRVTLVGAGGSANAVLVPIGYGYFNGGGGGSGALLEVVCRLRKREYYNIQVGQGNQTLIPSSFDGLEANGGVQGTADMEGGYGGAGGLAAVFTQPITIANGEVVDIISNVPGNNGQSKGGYWAGDYVEGGASVYENWGKGCATNSSVDSDGGVKVQFIDYEYTPTLRTLTINVDVPADISINGTSVATGVTTYDIETTFNRTLEYEVSASGYTTQTGSYTWLTTDLTDTLNITLDV